jgi:hypothetical protein
MSWTYYVEQNAEGSDGSLWVVARDSKGKQSPYRVSSWDRFWIDRNSAEERAEWYRKAQKTLDDYMDHCKNVGIHPSSETFAEWSKS